MIRICRIGSGNICDAETITIKKGKRLNCTNIWPAGGRPLFIPVPANWDETYSKWENKEITIDQFMEATGLKRGTLYNLIKAARGDSKQQETCS